MSDERWGWSTRKSPEMIDGAYSSRAEALDAAANDCAQGDVVYIFHGRTPDPARFVPSVDVILEMMGECAADEAGECVDDWPDVSEEAASELARLLNDWARKHCPCDFWLQDGDPEQVTL